MLLDDLSRLPEQFFEKGSGQRLQNIGSQSSMKQNEPF